MVTEPSLRQQIIGWAARETIAFFAARLREPSRRPTPQIIDGEVQAQGCPYCKAHDYLSAAWTIYLRAAAREGDARQILIKVADTKVHEAYGALSTMEVVSDEQGAALLKDLTDFLATPDPATLTDHAHRLSKLAERALDLAERRNIPSEAKT